MDAETRQDLETLKSRLREIGPLAVGFSGGVDSTLLVRAALDALGAENVLAVTIASEAMTPEELSEADALAEAMGAPHRRVDVRQLEIEACCHNAVDRCYHCKKVLFGKIIETARAVGLPTVIDGTTRDDAVDDYRPGRRAVAELGVRSPFEELGFTKDRIRRLSRALGLPNWNKASAACLLSRFPYDTDIDESMLRQVARAERLLRAEGFAQVRVRHHGETARIEAAPGDIARLAERSLRERISAALHEVGFQYVALDLDGYRTGSLNEGLSAEKRSFQK